MGYLLLSSANQIEIAESFLNLLRLSLLGSTQVESQRPYFELTSKLLLISTVRVSKDFFLRMFISFLLNVLKLVFLKK